jgi:hypothetical protein
MRVVEDPAKKYNAEFLKNNSTKINRAKNKHLAKAKEHGINYRVDEIDLVDSKYYNVNVGTKSKKNYRNNNNMDEEEDRKNVDYLNSDISIYYKQRNLKDKEDSYFDDYDDRKKIYYVEDNYPDYSKEKISFGDIEASSEKLYGSLDSRKEKEYNMVDNQTMQENFDYIDIMDRIKKEIYIKSKEDEKKTSGGTGKIIKSIREKFTSLFK